ncbi:MAG: electron transfer flavoprotein subunit beta/FixA family protein [Deltaproteobacteria bacterium]|nr:electron transfer flavoprotein subunit beta/FixA family protein [Deltaproteobacteria bacterium]
MNIIVCVKPAPDPKRWDSIQLDPQIKALRREGIPSVLGPLDRRALEEGLRIREKRGGKVVVMAMAPPSARDNLVEALAMGADEACLLSDRVFAGSDTWATSLVLARGIQKWGKVDLVLCGEWSLDGSTGHVGAQLAEYLGIPHVSRVVAVESLEGGILRTRSMVELGNRILESTLPALITVTRDVNTPRFTSLLGVMEAETKSLIVWSARELGIQPEEVGFSGSPTQTGDVFLPEMKRKAEVLKGEPEEMVPEIIRKNRQALG